MRTGARSEHFYTIPHAAALRLLPLATVATLVACAGPDSPSGPRLNPIADKVAQVGERLNFLVTVVPGTGTPPYEFLINTDRPPAAQWVRVSDTSARFAWTPEPGDVTPEDQPLELEFTVQDSAGNTDSQKVSVTVAPLSGPVFLNEPGYVLNLADSPSLQFPVRVKDDSVSYVDLELQQGPEGATLQTIGKKEALFYWRPSPTQISEKRFWFIRIQATGFVPGASPDLPESALYTVRHDISIVLVNGSGQGCPGTPPELLHTPPADVGVPAGASPIPLPFQVYVTDAESAPSDVRVFWSSGGAYGPFESAKLNPGGSDGLFSGVVSSQSFVPGTLVSYFFQAMDNDDPWETACDRLVRQPRSGLFVLAVTDSASPGSCVDDVYEGDTPTLQEGVLAPLRLCPSDMDSFQVPAVAGAVSLAISSGTPNAPITARLLGSDGAPLPAGLNSTGVLSAQLEENVTLTLEVRNEGDVPLGYWVTAAFMPDGCAADSAEPNQEPAQALPLSDGDLFQGSLCAEDRDLFRMEAPEQSSLVLTLNAQASAGDLDLLLLDEDGETVLREAATAQDVEQVSFWSKQARTLYVAVVGFEGAMNPYELSLSLLPASSACVDDLLAPNGTSSQAVALVPAHLTRLVLCPGTSDWYMLGLNGTEEVSVQVQAPAGKVGATLYRPDGSVLCSQKPEAGQLELNCTADAAGPHALEVLSDASGVPEYALDWSATLPGQTCTPDRFEPDSTADSATPVDDWAFSMLTLCRLDQDWFQIQLYAQQHLGLEARTLVPDGFPVMMLLGPDGNEVLGVAETVPGGSALEYDVEVAGKYFVRLEAEAAMTYSLLVYLE